MASETSKELNNSELLEIFNSAFREWVTIACQAWGYTEPAQEYFSHINQRLPGGLRVLLGYGIRNHLIITKGQTFNLEGLPQSKGPYNWFSRGRALGQPSLNWEYFVQVAEFIRFHTIVSVRNNLSLTFEDDLMDIGVYQNNKLLIYCEVKETIPQIQKLILEIKKLQSNVDLVAPDRSNDPLRKAKYLIRQKPEYLITSAIGARFEFKVVYFSGTSFELVRDVVPLV